MKVVKKLNNNVAICIDNNGRELVAFGKGIGFGKIPYELSDLSKIDRTFYDIDENHLSLFEEIGEEVINIAMDIVDYACEMLDYDYNSNLVFALADHISFIVENNKKGITTNSFLNYDIEYYYEKEKEVGDRAIEYINDKLGCNFPKSQSAGIALHFINAEKNTGIKRSYNEDGVIEHITQILEKELNISVAKNDFNYYRFATHMRHLLERLEQDRMIESRNKKLYEHAKKNYKKEYKCAGKIKKYLYKEFGYEINEEEELYLILHINRVCARN